MRSHRRISRCGHTLAAALAVLIGMGAAGGQRVERAPARGQTENVLFVMTDGLRWQEVFAGADDALMNRESGGVPDVPALKQAFWRETPEARRAVLMPFTWSVIARQGQLWGNQRRGSVARVTNGLNFSYPGYNETLCGFADPRIDSNDKRPNPNVTVLEWLHRKPAYAGKVAAFGAWDVLPYMLNRPRCGFYINAAFEPVTGAAATPRQELLNRLKIETPPRWAGEAFDSFTLHSALEYLKARRPRVLYLLLGETDEWAHEGRYAEYLHSALRVDGFLRLLWETAQVIPQYRGKTTLIFLPDHGRGDPPEEWKHHGARIKGSENTWVALLGPDTPPLGERSETTPVTQNQVAATLAAALGEDYCAAVPKAGKPIPGALRGSGE